MITKFENIQALRGIAVLLVVFFHLMLTEHKYWQHDYMLPNFLILGNSGVDLFFIISGFVMVVVTRNQFQNLTAIANFLYHRMTRIYPLYWVFSGLVLINYLLNPNLVNASQGHQVHILQSFLLPPQDKLSLLMTGWTLIHEMYFYLILTLLLFTPEKHFLKFLIGWGLLILIGNVLPHFDSSLASPAFLLMTHPLTFEFIAGCIIARLFYADIKPRPVLLLLFGLLLILLTFSIFYHFSENPMSIGASGWLRVFIFGTAGVCIVFSAVGFEAKAKLFPKFLQRIGNASYSIYLSHILIISACGRIFAKLFGQSIFSHVTFVIIALGAVIFVGHYSYVFLEKPLMRLSRKWREGVTLSGYKSAS